MDISIRKAKSTDAVNLLNYLKQVGSETDNLTFGKEGVSFSPEEEADYIKNIENSNDSVLLVAEINNEIVGTASLNRLPSRMSHRGDFGVSVLKQYWNNGIGSQLISEILNFAKTNNFEVIELQVRSDNLSAIHLYKKYGFIKIGEHSSFFKIKNKYLSFDYMILNIK